MSQPKLYAMKTSDTGEWVGHDSVRYCVMLTPRLYSGKHEGLTVPVECDAKHPCEWKEVVVLTAEELEQRERDAFEAGWKACESHFDPHSEIGGASLQIIADYKQWKEEPK